MYIPGFGGRTGTLGSGLSVGFNGSTVGFSKK